MASKKLSIFFKTFDTTLVNQTMAPPPITSYVLQSFLPVIYNKNCDLVISQNTFSPIAAPSQAAAIGSLYGYIEGTAGSTSNQLTGIGLLPGYTSNTVTYDTTLAIKGFHKISIPNNGNISLTNFAWNQVSVEDSTTPAGVFSGLHSASANGVVISHYCQYGTFQSATQKSNFAAMLSKFDTLTATKPGILLCYLNLKTSDVLTSLASYKKLSLNSAPITSSTATTFSSNSGTTIINTTGEYFIITTGLAVSSSIVPLMTPYIVPIAPEPFGLIVEIENISTQDSSENTTITNAINNTSGIPGYTVNTTNL